MDVTIAGTAITATVAGTTITATVTETVQSVSVASNGAQGAPGASGVVGVVSPITNTGTIGSATIGIDQTLLSITPSQVVGTAVTLTSGTIAKTQVAGTAVTLADTGTVTNAMLAKSTVTFNGQTVALGGTATITIATADYATLAGSATYAGSATLAGSALTAGTSSYASLAGTSTFATTATTAGSATNAGSALTAGTSSYATLSGTAVFSSTSGTASYSTLSGTAVFASSATSATTAGSASNAGTSVFASNAGTSVFATNAGTSVFSSTSGTATYATTAGTAVNISGTIAPSQVTGTAAVLGANTFVAAQILSPTAGVALTANGVTDAVTLIVKGGVSNTAALQQWQTSAATVASVSSSGAFTLSPSSGTNLTLNQATSGIGLVIKTAATTPGNLTEWQDKDGSILTRIGSDGSLFLNKVGTGVTAQIRTSSGAITSNLASDSIGLTIKAFLSQTVNLQEWQSSAASVLASVSSSGAFTLSPSSGTALTVNAASSAVGLVVKYSGTGTSDLTQWLDSNGTTVLASVSNTGVFFIRDASLRINTTGSYSARVNVNTGSDTALGLVIRASATTQTADFAQYQASAGTVLGGRNALAQMWSGSTAPVTVATGGATTAASGTGTTATITTTNAHGLAVGDLVTVAGVTPTGYNATAVVTAVTSTTFSYANTTTGSQTVAGTVSVPAQASITARSAGTVPLVVRGAASHVADFFSVSTSGGTSKYFSVDVNGATVIGAANNIVAGAINNGGSMRILKADSAGGGVANYVRLQVVAGTNANTLKLIAIGPGGTVYTLQDNMN